MVYKRRLLMEFSNENVTPTASVSGRSIKQDITITLTPREFEILGLIAAGLSNKAIQERLLLSKNTVRTHIKNLYSKLGVHSRTKAIQQAREIGLI
jgi:ATP/maltotriose-dependent transcriptional regulator MalT